MDEPVLQRVERVGCVVKIIIDGAEAGKRSCDAAAPGFACELMSACGLSLLARMRNAQLFDGLTRELDGLAVQACSWLLDGALHFADADADAEKEGLEASA